MSEQRSGDKLSAMREIAARFPEAFGFPIRPLTLTARRDLMGLGYTKEVVQQVLRMYCSRPDYLAATVSGTCRVNLDGTDADVPTQEHIDHAKVRLEAYRAQQRQRRQATHQAAEEKPAKSQRKKERKPPAAKSPVIRQETQPSTLMGTAMQEAFAKLKAK